MFLMPFVEMKDDSQRILYVVIVYKGKEFTFNFAMQRRPERFAYLYNEAKVKIPPIGSIETCLISWPENLMKIDYNSAHLMINASRDRYDDPMFRFLNELYIRGYPQPTYELAMDQAIRWCTGIVRFVYTAKEFTEDDLENGIEFELDREPQWFIMR